MRKNILLITIAVITICLNVSAQKKIPGEYPIKAISMGPPSPANLDSFVVFVNNELAPRGVNTIFLLIDYNYKFKSRPELTAEDALTEAEAKKILKVCRDNGIKVIPQINLFGHQSWASKPSKLLEVYPEFDETPWIKLPENYVWPNKDSLYCKSYCPLHPGVHKVIFPLIDELCEVFESDGFHAGMDEIFYIGMDKCPRCKGKNNADLFAGEVNRIRDHLAKKNRTMYIWADRLIDGFATGVGGWEGSYNHTWQAINKIPKDVVMCDWHYERPDKTAPYFAALGFKVITSTWNRPAVAVEQHKDMQKFFAESAPEMSSKFLGMCQTVWTSTSNFMSEYYANAPDTGVNKRSNARALRSIFPVVQKAKAKQNKDFPIVAYALCKSPDEIKNIDFSSITHLNFAFINPDSTGNFAYNACLDSLVKVAHANGVKVLASIGGGSAPEYYSTLLKDGKRRQLVSGLTHLALAYGLDGIDVDLEGGRIDANYEKLVSELASSLKPANKLLTAAIATVYKDRITDKALKHFDYITIMTYDKTGPWRPEKPGHHSPYSMAEEDLNYWVNTRKLDKNKLYLGLPFYGHSFGPAGASSMSFKDIVVNYPGSENKDELKMQDGSTLYYNGIPTIRKKVELAKQKAGGVMFWQLAQDATGDKSLLKTINEVAYPK